ncbi:hypothetical protein AYI69_g5505 [Smittium culicis]|uniref:Uncharacterized protein n=1 Tax=Smittium culicis TaxID=133412 RepID=A0A1R1Y5U3_9FUNG|nr:hypothetical protein AYI69_g5505 [Smittium culicis]
MTMLYPNTNFLGKSNSSLENIRTSLTHGEESSPDLKKIKSPTIIPLWAKNSYQINDSLSTSNASTFINRNFPKIIPEKPPINQNPVPKTSNTNPTPALPKQKPITRRISIKKALSNNTILKLNSHLHKIADSNSNSSTTRNFPQKALSSSLPKSKNNLNPIASKKTLSPSKRMLVKLSNTPKIPSIQNISPKIPPTENPQLYSNPTKCPSNVNTTSKRFSGVNSVNYPNILRKYSNAKYSSTHKLAPQNSSHSTPKSKSIPQNYSYSLASSNQSHNSPSPSKNKTKTYKTSSQNSNKYNTSLKRSKNPPPDINNLNLVIASLQAQLKNQLDLIDELSSINSDLCSELSSQVDSTKLLAQDVNQLKNDNKDLLYDLEVKSAQLASAKYFSHSSTFNSYNLHSFKIDLLHIQDLLHLCNLNTSSLDYTLPQNQNNSNKLESSTLEPNDPIFSQILINKSPFSSPISTLNKNKNKPKTIIANISTPNTNSIDTPPYLNSPNNSHSNLDIAENFTIGDPKLQNLSIYTNISSSPTFESRHFASMNAKQSCDNTDFKVKAPLKFPDLSSSTANPSSKTFNSNPALLSPKHPSNPFSTPPIDLHTSKSKYPESSDSFAINSNNPLSKNISEIDKIVSKIISNISLSPSSKSAPIPESIDFSLSPLSNHSTDINSITLQNLKNKNPSPYLSDLNSANASLSSETETDDSLLPLNESSSYLSSTAGSSPPLYTKSNDFNAINGSTQKDNNTNGYSIRRTTDSIKTTTSETLTNYSRNPKPEMPKISIQQPTDTSSTKNLPNLHKSSLRSPPSLHQSHTHTELKQKSHLSISHNLSCHNCILLTEAISSLIIDNDFYRHDNKNLSNMLINTTDEFNLLIDIFKNNHQKIFSKSPNLNF